MIINPENLSSVDCHRVITAAVAPRPIAFVSTISTDGIYNCAPYSFFNALASQPMIIGFSTVRKRDGEKKDTLINIEETREFVVNVVVESLTDAMNLSSKGYPSTVDEFEETGLTPVPCDIVSPPRIKESPVNLECRCRGIIEFGTLPRITSFIIGDVVLIHADDDFVTGGAIDYGRLGSVGRLGGNAYCIVSDIFEMERPQED